MKYTIYQIPSIKKGTPKDIYRKYSFAPLRWIDEVNLNNYKEVYSDNVPYEKSVYMFLEKLFKKFNLDRPIDFTGHSLSVSDIVKINTRYYFCDSIGWKYITFDENGIYKVKKL
jgi:hypothetical protein